MNLFVISKNKLKDIVESSGFSTKIEVIERTEELQLLSCREFFNDNNIAVVEVSFVKSEVCSTSVIYAVRDDECC